MDADKKRLWVSGQLVEVTDEVYDAYMKGDSKMRYFESDLKAERLLMDESGQIKQVIPSREDSLDRLMDDNAEQFADWHESVEDMVLRRISIERLYKALDTLTEKERKLIEALFFEEMTERAVALSLGISQPAVHKQKNKILKKLKPQMSCGLLAGGQEGLYIRLCDCRQQRRAIGILSIPEIMEICYGSFYQTLKEKNQDIYADNKVWANFRFAKIVIIKQVHGMFRNIVM